MPTETELRAKAKECGLQFMKLGPTSHPTGSNPHRYVAQNDQTMNKTVSLYAYTLAGMDWLLDRYIFQRRNDKEHRQRELEYFAEHPCPENEVQAALAR